MRSRRRGGIDNNPSSKGKELEEDNYSDDAFSDSDDDDSVDENAFNDSDNELITDENCFLLILFEDWRMRSRRGGGINNNPSSKGKEVEEDNYNDDNFNDSNNDDSFDENDFDDYTDELLTNEFNSYLSQMSHELI
ncbi:hypothetical protein V6N11_034173 [Hibiscus sabdariffa]|uniref:Uncharacterized protein n=1 Tax=Hibiscus sabdariffa TaxID=183260 RepID=A0ABR2S2G2_9ROSI